MSKKIVQQILTMLQAGILPIYRLSPRKGNDSRLMRITGTDHSRFQGVFVDDSKEEIVFLAHKSVEDGHLAVEYMESSAS